MSADTTAGGILILECPSERQVGPVADVIDEYLFPQDEPICLLVIGHEYLAGFYGVRCAFAEEAAEALAQIPGVKAITFEYPTAGSLGVKCYVSDGRLESYEMDSDGNEVVETAAVLRLLEAAEVLPEGADKYETLKARLAELIGDTPLVRELKAKAAAFEQLAGGRSEVPPELPRLAVPSLEQRDAWEAEEALALS